MIVCKRCKTPYDCYEDNFIKDKRSETEYRDVCKVCDRAYKKQWRDNNKETTKLKNAAYYKKVVQPKTQKVIRAKKAKKTLRKNTRNLPKYLKKLNWQEPATQSYKDLLVW